jgi:hypothetical protein
MKIKLFGIPIIEYQPHETSLPTGFVPPAVPPVSRFSRFLPKPEKWAKSHADPIGDGEIPNQKSLDDLSTDPASMLPTHKVRGKKRINMDAALDLYGITDPNDLWRRDFKPGSAGCKLRAALGSIGHGPNKDPKSSVAEPSALTASQLADVENLSAAILPRRPNGKLDVEAGLKLLKITDPAELWQRKMKFGTALHLLKQAIGTNEKRMAEIRKQLAEGGKPA